MNKPIKFEVDCNSEEDDTVAFFSKQVGKERIVIVPKTLPSNTFEITETPTTYVITIRDNF